MISVAVALVASALMLLQAAPAQAACTVTSPVPSAIVTTYNLDTSWYNKYVDAGGIPVLGSSVVENATLCRAADIVIAENSTSHSPVAALNSKKVRAVIVARSEKMSSIPEVNEFWGTSLDDRYWGGFGATEAVPICAGTEKNIIDNYGSENVFVHEWGHGLMDLGLSASDPNFTSELNAAWNSRGVGKNKLWSNTYAGDSIGEYFTEGLQVYFGTQRPGPVGGDGIHNNIDTRAELQSYDTDLYNLLQRLYGGANLPAIADYTMTTSPETASVKRGNSVNATITIAASGYNSLIWLVPGALPSGVSVSVVPGSLTGSGAATVTISTAPNASTGVKWIPIYGLSAREHLTGVTLTITR